MFPHLFKEGRLGSLSIKNRIVMACIDTNYAQDSYVGQQMVDFFRERAAGGTGLVIAGAYQVDEGSGREGPLSPGIGEERFLPGLKELTQAIHAEGALAAFQLFHPGKYAHSSVIGGPPVSPSPIPSRFTGETPRELTVPEIKEIQRKFVEDIDRGRRVGFDAVEINACTGYLVREFLSPITNQRNDDYGGSLENRLRFLLEIIRLAREEVGGYPIICRISGHELLPRGNGLPEAKAIAGALETAGVDAIHVTMGGHETTVPITPSAVPPGAWMPLIHQIKRAVRVPVIGGIRINEPQLAESALREGLVDFVSMARPLHADPYFPRKALEGSVEDIVPCIGCQEGCFDRLFADEPVTCLVNPRAGYEGERQVSPAIARKRVLVIGGGPGGMEAALVTTQRGHQVTLWEKDDHLGGQFHPASASPEKGDFQRLLSYLEIQLKKKGVRVELGRTASVETVTAFNPEAVVVATGSNPRTLSIPGAQFPHVVHANDILEGKVGAGNRVVVIGGGGVGCDVALFLAYQGGANPEASLFLTRYQVLPDQEALAATRGPREVTVVEMLPRLGNDIGRTTRWSTLLSLRKSGVQTVAEARAEEITEEGVWVSHKEGRRFLPADTIVLAVGAWPENRLFNALKSNVKEIHLVGDAVRPRSALYAIHEAFLVACQL
ncbi:MAG: FAD-dependent oxidoreductase [Chloroflexi bacterium]|nr:FAD-dependent oxidoreductase [Chloroflexota bacterium]